MIIIKIFKRLSMFWQFQFHISHFQSQQPQTQQIVSISDS